MPQKGDSQKPPEAMTWGRAVPVIAVAAVFDLLRAFFEMFWFLAPAIATVYCTAKVNGVLTSWTAGLLGAKTAATACTAGVVGAIAGLTAITGGMSAEAVEAFSIIMAIAVGILGFIALGIWILVTNPGLFRANASNAIWFVGGFLIGEVPFVGAIPTFSVTLFKAYWTQIKKERAALLRWQKEHAREIAAQRRAQQEQAAYIMQARAAELAANDIY